MNDWSRLKILKENMSILRQWHLLGRVRSATDTAEMYALRLPEWVVYRVVVGYCCSTWCRGSWRRSDFDRWGEYDMAKAVSSVLEKVLKARASVSLGMGRASPADLAEYPALSEMLTSTMYPGGEVREVSRLSVYADAENGGWRTMLTEPSQLIVLWSHADTLSEVLRATEEHVVSEKADWRNDRYAAKRGGKKGRG